MESLTYSRKKNKREFAKDVSGVALATESHSKLLDCTEQSPKRTYPKRKYTFLTGYLVNAIILGPNFPVGSMFRVEHSNSPHISPAAEILGRPRILWYKCWACTEYWAITLWKLRRDFYCHHKFNRCPKKSEDLYWLDRYSYKTPWTIAQIWLRERCVT